MSGFDGIFAIILGSIFLIAPLLIPFSDAKGVIGLIVNILIYIRNHFIRIIVIYGMLKFFPMVAEGGFLSIAMYLLFCICIVLLFSHRVRDFLLEFFVNAWIHILKILFVLGVIAVIIYFFVYVFVISMSK